jgi:hypothetical protein
MTISVSDSGKLTQQMYTTTNQNKHPWRRLAAGATAGAAGAGTTGAGGITGLVGLVGLVAAVRVAAVGGTLLALVLAIISSLIIGIFHHYKTKL